MLIGIGFAIAGLPSPVVFGVLAALLSHAARRRRGIRLGAGRGLAVLSTAAGASRIFMLVWGLMLAGLDNVLRPMLISGRARISALAVFIGVLGGIPAFGAIGIIAGPVVLSLVLALIEFAEESRRRDRAAAIRAARTARPRRAATVQSAPLWTYLIFSTG